MNTLLRITKMLFKSNNLLNKVLEGLQAIQGHLSQLDIRLRQLQESRSERLLTAKEVAAILGVSVRTVQRWQKMGRLASLKSGGQHLYLETEVRCMKL